MDSQSYPSSMMSKDDDYDYDEYEDDNEDSCSDEIIKNLESSPSLKEGEVQVLSHAARVQRVKFYLKPQSY